MTEQNPWVEAALAPLHKWLADDPGCNQPEDLKKTVQEAVAQAIRLDRAQMWTRLAGKQVLYRHPSGVSFWVRLGDGMSMFVIRSERDDASTRFLLSRLTTGGTFLDIGANTGWYALRAAHRYREIGGGRVHAFEPQPIMSSLIADSIEENDFSDTVDLHRLALGDREQTVWMATLMNSGGSTVRLKERENSSPVEMRPLDSLDLPTERVDIIKIDIEGAEPLFVNGAKEFLRKYRPPIYSEVHPRKLVGISRSSREEYIAQVEELGYRTMSIGKGDELEPFDRTELNDTEKLINVVFEPV